MPVRGLFRAGHVPFLLLPHGAHAVPLRGHHGGAGDLAAAALNRRDWYEGCCGREAHRLLGISPAEALRREKGGGISRGKVLIKKPSLLRFISGTVFLCWGRNP